MADLTNKNQYKYGISSFTRGNVYRNVNGFINTDIWDIAFIEIPNIFTDNTRTEFMNKWFRLHTDSINPPAYEFANPVAVSVKGHQLSQPGKANKTGQLSLNAMDFDDVSIREFSFKINQAYADLSTGLSLGNYGPNDFRWTIELVRFSDAKVPLYRWWMDSGIYSGFSQDESMTADRTPLGPSTLSWSFDAIEPQVAKCDFDDKGRVVSVKWEGRFDSMSSQEHTWLSDTSDFFLGGDRYNYEAQTGEIVVFP